MNKSAILYELNEVPWEIVDLYVSEYPESNIAHLLAHGSTFTTVNSDTVLLSPWRTWPTLHKSMSTENHNSYELGQDPETFRGTNLWEVLENAGYSIGVFGALQSWPAREPASGGFYVPDTFARDGKTVPRRVESFQEFNLRMTSENAFSSDRKLSTSALARAGAALLTLGLKRKSFTKIVQHLIRERRDRRFRAARPMMQVLPSFDVYWRLHKQYNPDLSIFFTNHVAAMMHRYWGDVVPTYAEQFDYEPDEVFATFVLEAMHLADAQIGVIARHVRQTPGARVVVAASMGQGPVAEDSSTVSNILHLEDGRKLASALGFPSAVTRLAMYPMCSLDFDDESDAREASDALTALKDKSDRPIFEAVEHRGTTTTFRTSRNSVRTGGGIDDAGLIYRTDCRTQYTHAELGLVVSSRLGGDNTAYHVPTGILIDYAAEQGSGDRRTEIDVLDVAPSLLANVFKLQVPDSMSGKATTVFTT